MLPVPAQGRAKGGDLMQKIAVKIKKLMPEAKMPTYASPDAAGADLGKQKVNHG